MDRSEVATKLINQIYDEKRICQNLAVDILKLREISKNKTEKNQEIQIKENNLK